MSRNLCSTECHRCNADSVKLDEAPRFILPKEAGAYFDEYDGMLVANATCPTCDARYLAWCSPAPGMRGWNDYERREYGYFDLSYRSSFNDEPGPGDLPKPRVLVELDEWLLWHDINTDRVRRARDALANLLHWTED